jgi:uncharacterized protein Veg
MNEKFDLFEIKKDMENFVGGKIKLRANKGRKKSFVREGILESTYPSIFIVRFENDYESVRRVSFTYSDVLTKAVEVVLCRGTEMVEVGVS